MSRSSVAAPESSKRRRRRSHRVTAPPGPREFLTRAELLAFVPMSMSSIDALEKRGEFPSRFRLPLNRVLWRRSEIEKFLENCAKRERVHKPAKPEPPRAITSDSLGTG
jgi:prophage regulatory protein